MTTAEQVGWGKYLQYEGPFFRGTVGFKLASNPTDAWKVMATLTATEGGHADAVNMYDRMINTVGYCQWGEAGTYAVSGLLGYIIENKPELLGLLQPALDAAGAKFRKNVNSKWRFVFNDARGEVDNLQEQQGLFLLHSKGTKGTWDDTSKAFAKQWAACQATLLSDPDAQNLQVQWSLPRLRLFAYGSAKTDLWGENTPASDGIAGAARAIYLSFAANLPAVAMAQYTAFSSSTQEQMWSEGWLIGLCKQLTFGPNIAIYPHRYNAIRPVVEKLYGLDLPDFAEELKTWQAENDIEVCTYPGAPPSFTTTMEIQTELVAEGFDLGPVGPDGVFGPKTLAALMSFQQANGLTADGVVGPKTRTALRTKWESRSGTC